MNANMTTYEAHGYKVGDTISISSLDNRWWKRLKCKVLFQPRPMIRDKFTVTDVSSDNTITTEILP